MGADVGQSHSLGCVAFADRFAHAKAGAPAGIRTQICGFGDRRSIH